VPPEAFPQTFVLEKHRPHRPLKVGIAADIPARCPDLGRRLLNMILGAYTRRVMYLQSVVAGAARVDLDGKEAGKVTARDAEYAAATLPRSWHHGLTLRTPDRHMLAGTRPAG
jgi:ProP effector